MVEQTEQTEIVKLSLEKVHELSADDLAELFDEDCELVVEGALSEWGSHVEELIHKLERGVNKWYKVGRSKRFIIHFVEVAASEKE